MSERWKPGDKYYYVNSKGKVDFYRWNDDSLDEAHHEFGNCFGTKEQAEAAAAKIKELLLSLPAGAETASAELPKLTEEIFNHPDCPEWARYAAVDADGRAYWFKTKPVNGATPPCYIRAWGSLDAKKIILGFWDSSDWLHSLIERPKSKLTTEVFDRPDCPKWAKYAAVSPYGSLVFFEEKPEHDLGCWIAAGFKSAIVKGDYDDSNWKNSLIERPKPRLTEEIFNRTDCPKDAKIAVVAEDGRAFWGTHETATPENGGWAGKGGGVWDYIPGKFDTSDWQNSLVKRPSKLPDWCKVGEWVYSTVYKEYVKIKDIDKFDVEFDRGAYCTVSHKAFVEDYKPASPRPYNADEMKALVGKVLELDGNRDLVTSYDEESETVYADSMWMSADELLSNGYTIDGELCSVLEHLEDGEWVK